MDDRAGAVSALHVREIELLLACARTSHDDALAARLAKLLRAEGDWDALMQLAMRHKLVPLLYWHLSQLGASAAPDEFMAQARVRCFAIAARNRRLADELLAVTRRLAEAGVPTLAFKGPALAAMVYHDPALRVSSDLDILVRRRDLALALGVLAAHGYRQVFRHSRLFEALARPFRHAANLVSADFQSQIDLHWKLSQSYYAFALRGELIWRRLAPVRIGGELRQTLAPEALLIVLCMHGGRHCWLRLAWLCDLAEFLRAYPQLDWPAVLTEAAALHSTRLLLLGLWLAHALLGADLPAVVHCAAADPAVAQLAEQVRAWLYAGVAEPPASEQARFYLAARERWVDRALFVPELARILLAELRPRAAVSFGALRPRLPD